MSNKEGLHSLQTLPCEERLLGATKHMSIEKSIWSRQPYLQASRIAVLLVHLVYYTMTTPIAKSFYDLSATDLQGEKVDFNHFRGRVVLIENVASFWATTVRDYTQMNQLQSKYPRRLVVLGFPCNQFGYQVSPLIQSLFMTFCGNEWLFLLQLQNQFLFHCEIVFLEFLHF